MSIRTALIVIGLLLHNLHGCSSDTSTVEDVLVAVDDENSKEDTHTPSIQGPDWIDGEFQELLRSNNSLSTLTIYQGDDQYVPQLTTGLFADITGDNMPEVLISTVPHDVYEVAQTTEIDHQIYTFNSNTKKLELLSGTKFPKGRIVLAEDLDGDSYVDLVFANTSPNEVVSWGGGGGQFNKVAALVDPALLPDQEGNPNPDYPGDLGNDHVLDDVDSDGWLDIVTSGFCTRPQARPFLRTSLREYTYEENIFDFLTHGSVWSLHMMRLKDGEHLLLMPGEDGKSCDNNHIFFQKTQGMTSKNYPMFEEFDPLPVKMDLPPEIKFGPRMASPMGLAIGDLNGDEFLDIAISQDPHRSILAGTGTWPMKEVSAESGLFMLPSDKGPPLLAWGMALLDLDYDGRADIVSVHGDDDPRFLIEAQSVGPQHTTAHWNAGDFKFADISAQINIDRRGNWRALSVGDLDRDNRPDLIIGGFGEMPQVLLNRITSPYNYFSLRLRGTTSNHLGIGAHIRVQALEDGPVQTLYMGAVGSPVATSQARAFVGLGEAEKAHVVEIHWPSGVIQRVENLDAGTYHVLEEPEVMGLSPTTRHVIADGASLAEIRVQPELLSPETSASVEVTIEQIYGDAEFTGPATFDGTHWVRSLRSTAAGTSSVIEVTIDGAPLHIRPRVWWDSVPESP